MVSKIDFPITLIYIFRFVILMTIGMIFVKLIKNKSLIRVSVVG